MSINTISTWNYDNDSHIFSMCWREKFRYTR